MQRNRVVSAAALVVAVVAFALVTLVTRESSSSSINAVAATDTTAPPTTIPASTAAPTTTSTTVPRAPAIEAKLELERTITGAIAPKSVTATGSGLVFAQNMMYQHTVTVYDRDGALVKTIADGVDLSQFGIDGHPGISRGAPVEAAVDAAHRSVFVSNYSMYGANFGPEGSDSCTGPGSLSRSYVYRVNVEQLAIDGVGEVGMVPKYVAVTPDDRYVLVTNWCSYDLTVLDHDSLKVVSTVHLGAYPRGIVVDPTSRTAYVAVMGSYDIARVDLRSFAVSWFRGVGNAPRHLVLSNDGRKLFVTLNGANEVVAVDTATGNVTARTNTGQQPRSMAISADGTALFVVNYGSDTMSVVRTSDLSVVKSIAVPDHPIGVTYEPVAHRVWVACYSGAILVYNT